MKERTKRLLEINEIVEKLDETIRQAAFLLLQDYVSNGEACEKGKNLILTDKNIENQDRGAFFSKFNHEKPADNALLVGAYYYSQYGTLPFTIDEIKALTNEVGVTIPERVDMTFAQAKRDDKNLFLRSGRGAFRSTVYGEAFLKKLTAFLKVRCKKIRMILVVFEISSGCIIH